VARRVPGLEAEASLAPLRVYPHGAVWHERQ